MDKAIRAANIKLIHSLTRQGEESMGTKLSLVQMIAAALAAACCTSAAAAQGIGRLRFMQSHQSRYRASSFSPAIAMEARSSWAVNCGCPEQLRIISR